MEETNLPAVVPDKASTARDSAKKERELLNQLAFCRQFSKKKFYGDHEAAAMAAGLPPDTGLKYLRIETVIKQIADLRRGEAAAMMDDLQLMETLVKIIKDRDTNAKARVDVIREYRKIREEYVMGRNKDEVKTTPGTVYNQQFNFTNADRDELENKIRSGEMTIEQAAAMCCGEVLDEKRIEKGIQRRERYNTSKRTKVEIELEKKTSKLIKKAKSKKIKDFLKAKLEKQKETLSKINENDGLNEDEAADDLIPSEPEESDSEETLF